MKRFSLRGKSLSKVRKWTSCCPFETGWGWLVTQTVEAPDAQKSSGAPSQVRIWQVGFVIFSGEYFLDSFLGSTNSAYNQIRPMSS